MIKQIIICDRCKREIDESNRIKAMDFCNYCFSPIIEWLERYVEEEDEEEIKQEDIKQEDIKQEVNTTKKSKYNIDWNKACALKLAGWKNKDIADEVKCTTDYINSLIYKRLAEYKAKRGIE